MPFCEENLEPPFNGLMQENYLFCVTNGKVLRIKSKQQNIR